MKVKEILGSFEGASLQGVELVSMVEAQGHPSYA